MVTFDGMLAIGDNGDSMSAVLVDELFKRGTNPTELTVINATRQIRRTRTILFEGKTSAARLLS